jgi:CheY-like chemotaxis protein
MLCAPVPLDTQADHRYYSVMSGAISASLPKEVTPLSSNMRIGNASAEGAATRHAIGPYWRFSIDAPRNFSSPELVNLRGHADAFQSKVRSEGRDARRRTRNEEMPAKERGCALLADRHLGLAEGVRGLLETEFEAVVVVGDEVSLFESVRQLHVAIAVVDLSLRRRDGLGLIRRIRSLFPQLKLIALSIHEEKNAELAAIDAGAN